MPIVGNFVFTNITFSTSFLTLYDLYLCSAQLIFNIQSVYISLSDQMVLLYCKKYKFFQKYSFSKIVYTIIIMAFLSFIFFLSNICFDFTNANLTHYLTDNYSDTSNGKLKKTPMKYILLWTDKNDFPFIYFGEGNTVFVNKKCEWSNCYVTGDRYALGDYSIYDVIVFNGPQLQYHSNIDDMPKYRSNRQKYVYANIEGAANYPVCSKMWDNFFNWTWTYKLNSDAVWGYFVIKNASNHVIGPSEHMYWMNTEDTNPINEELKLKLQSKNQAVAWFVSNCDTLNKREKYVEELKKYLSKYRLFIDIYGKCGSLQCPKAVMNRCLKIIEKKYYFYLAFENANSEDYVTEKILNAVNHNTVPVVYGGANYSRFLPPESYLNAFNLSPETLAEEIYDIIQNPRRYYNFFKWKNHYTYHLRHESPFTDDYCSFCAMINDKSLMTRKTIYKDFDAWWRHVIDCSFI